LFQSPNGALARFTGRKNERTIQQQQKTAVIMEFQGRPPPNATPPPGKKALLGDY